MAIYSQDYIPYFYIIQDVRNGMYYAGSKWGKDTNPSNFMTEGGYETSSKELIRQHGLSNFIIRKIKTFETGDKAHRYESRFLQRVNAKKHPKFYNKHNNDGIGSLYHDEIKKIINERYGVDHVMHVPEIKQKSLENKEKAFMDKYGVRHNFSVPEVREGIKITTNERYGVDYYSQTAEWKEKTIKTSNERYGVDHWQQSEKGKKILREENRKQFLDPVKRERHRIATTEKNPAKGTIWITKNKINKRIKLEYLRQYENEGWVKGRFFEREGAFWNYDKSGSNNPFFGKKHTEETRSKISKKIREKKINNEKENR